MEFLKQTLPNGLEIVAECNSQAHSSAVAFFVRTGARDETDEEAGVSHFLEHMMFKGTPTRSADDVNREFDEMGAQSNAFTHEEITVYHAAMLPEHLDDAVALLGDMLRPSLRTEDFDLEKQVILEEIQMYEDQPPFGADEKCRALYFGSHPLGRSVLGTAGSITELPVEAMRDYFQRRYSPDNIVLVAAGRIDFDSLVATARQCCGDWEPTSCSRQVDPSVPGEGFHVVSKASAAQQYALQLSNGPSATDPERYAAKLLATVLGDASGSRLYWELIDPGLADHASLSHCEHEGAGIMMTCLSCDPELATENLQRIHDVYRRAETEGITAEELQQAKSKVRSQIVLSSERPRGRLFLVGSDWVYRREYCDVQHDLDKVAAMTLDEVTKVLARFPLTRGTTMTIGPLADVVAPK